MLTYGNTYDAYIIFTALYYRPSKTKCPRKCGGLLHVALHIRSYMYKSTFKQVYSTLLYNMQISWHACNRDSKPYKRQ